MCLAVPMRIVAIEGPVAQVEEAGVRREARIDFLEDAVIGDYVIVHAGVAIQKMSAEEAAETLRLMELLVDAGPE
jgi:hydrogenase expression/formation protein HypC